MIFSVQVKLLGVPALKRLLKNLGSSGARQAIRAGVGKALAVVRKAIRKEVPPHAKSIRSAIGSKVKVNKTDGVVAKVGINVNKKKGRGYARQGALYVLGSGPRKTEAGRELGRMPANPVVQRGAAKAEKQAQREMAKKIREVLKKQRRKR